MRTTIKTEHGKVTAEPLPDGAIQLTIDQGMDYATVELTPDQIGALLFGIERAAEAAQIAHEAGNVAYLRTAGHEFHHHGQ